MSITYILKSNFILRTRAKLLILHDDNFTRYIYKLRKAKLRICTCTGAIFEQGSEEVQSAFKFAILTYNKNVSGRRFELQAFVDIINTADAFKLSRLNVRPRLIPKCRNLPYPFFTRKSVKEIYDNPKNDKNKEDRDQKQKFRRADNNSVTGPPTDRRSCHIIFKVAKSRSHPK
ncbi:hypothetical protein PGB90_009274 [Kerria lacca]